LAAADTAVLDTLERAVALDTVGGEHHTDRDQVEPRLATATEERPQATDDRARHRDTVMAEPLLAMAEPGQLPDTTRDGLHRATGELGPRLATTRAEPDPARLERGRLLDTVRGAPRHRLLEDRHRALAADELGRPMVRIAVRQVLTPDDRTRLERIRALAILAASPAETLADPLLPRGLEPAEHLRPASVQAEVQLRPTPVVGEHLLQASGPAEDRLQ